MADRTHRSPSSQGLPPEAVEFAELSEQIHDSLDVQAVAATVVKQTKFWTGCSRVSVFVKRGRRCRLLAVSDQEEVDRRSRALRSMERAADVVARGGRAVWTDGGASADAGGSFPAEVEAPEWPVCAVPLIESDNSV